MPRRPVPTRLKLAKGNPGRRPINKKEPKPKTSAIPKPAAYLDCNAKTFWRQNASELHRLGLLTVIDTLAFEMMASAHSLARQAREALEKEGHVITVTGSSGQPRAIINPWFYIFTSQSKSLLALFAEFGMTPSSRSRISATPPQEEQNPFADFEPNTPTFDKFRRDKRRSKKT